MLGAHVAARKDLQCREKFVAEIILTAADAGEGRGRAQHGALADLRAVVGLDPPDGDDEMPVDPVGLFHLIEDRAVPGQNGATLLDAFLAHEEIEIVPHRFAEFGLRVEEIHDVQLRREARDMGVEEGARHAAARGQRPQASETAREIGGGSANGLCCHERMPRSTGLAAPVRI